MPAYLRGARRRPAKPVIDPGYPPERTTSHKPRLFTRAPPPPCDPVGKEALEQRSRRRSHLACHWTRADRPLLKRGEHAGISGAPGGSVVRRDPLDLAVGETRYRRSCQSNGRRMGRYKDYDREPKRGGYDDDQKSDDRTSRSSAKLSESECETNVGIGRSDRQMVQCREGLWVCRSGRRVRGIHAHSSAGSSRAQQRARGCSPQGPNRPGPEGP